VLTYLTPQEVATLYGVRVATVHMWAARYGWTKITGRKRVLYLAADVARSRRAPS
jgi:uncharacterized protein YjcR